MTRANPVRLQKMRSRLIALYDSAKKAHRGQAKASRKVFDATTALLKAEVAAHQRRTKTPARPSARAAIPDLFSTEALHG